MGGSLRFNPIEDYAMIGDCRSAALVSRGGSIDWFCWPRFDSPALFAGILDITKGGHWQISPAGRFESTRRYEASSNVLVTTFLDDEGEVTLTDLLFAASEREKRSQLLPQTMLIRRVECVRGTMTLLHDFEPAPDFGRTSARLRSASEQAWTFPLGEGLALLATTQQLEKQDPGLRGRFAISQGQHLDFVLAYSEEAPAVFPPLGDVGRLIETTNAYWRAWAQRIGYEGPHRAAVHRSALALKLLTYAPSGAIIAAPTTSLPERVGAGYNWDYRFCWLRDASYTVNALLGLGMRDEAFAFLQWLLHATVLTRPELQVVYSVLGKPVLAEEELDHLEGYMHSKPVRVGNAAHGQFQLDVYGEVISAATLCYEHGVRLSGDERAFLRRLADFISENWQMPDSGIWETREEMQQFVHSRVTAWAGLDRVIQIAEAGHVKADTAKYKAVASQIASDIRQRGFNKKLDSYVAALDGEDLDAAVLRLPLIGFEAASSPRMAATIDTIRRELSRDGLVYRHRGEETAGEGAFLICSFWLVQCLAMQGRLEEAEDLFDSLCGRANDVGLFGEEIEPESGTFLGNFPQAFTHIGLINAALTLQEAGGRR